MGSVLCDPRFVYWVYTHPDDGSYEERQTFADVEYRFWDMWRSNKPMPFLPGQFSVEAFPKGFLFYLRVVLLLRNYRLDRTYRDEFFPLLGSPKPRL